MKLYAWLWYHVEFWLKPEARRPFTFILRDFYHNSPLITIFMTLTAGYIIGRNISISFLVWLGLLFGFVLGHLFWGQPYKPDEQEYPEYNPDKK